MKDRPILWVFLAFVLGFALPVCTCIGTGMITLGALGRVAQPPMPGLRNGDAVAIISLEGAITGGQEDTFITVGITPRRVRSLLEQAEVNPSVKAVVVRVNSPGGSVVASNEIYNALLAFEKPVVVLMDETAASGGYYIALGGDHVMAHPDTLTGSIGVISQFLSVEELMEKVGVEAVVITSGPRKDIGSPFRDMTEEEQDLWREILDQVYDGFVEVVAEARGLPRDTVRELADGRIYTGQQAKELGLVDSVGTRQAAIEKAAELGNIEDEPRVIELRIQPSLLEMVYGFQARSVLPAIEDLVGRSGIPSLQFRVAEP